MADDQRGLAVNGRTVHGGLASELRFLAALWRTNLLSAMEYRASFISQVVGMMVNNAVYFTFWVIFFNEFDQVRGWGLQQMLVLFGIVATAFGLGVLLFGNVMQVAGVVATGRLDYYLSLPRPVLLHVLASRSLPSGLGDFTYGILSFAATRPDGLAPWLRFGAAVAVAMGVFLGFLILIQGLAFWFGNAQVLSSQAMNALVTFALYPITLFDSSAKFLLFTVVPSAFVGALPANLVEGDLGLLLPLVAVSGGLLAVSVLVFQVGLKRYESGSAIGAAV